MGSEKKTPRREPPTSFPRLGASDRGSLAANRALAAEPARWPALLARVDRFLGDPLSRALYFRGLCVQYCREIRYLDAMRDARRACADSVGLARGAADGGAHRGDLRERLP